MTKKEMRTIDALVPRTPVLFVGRPAESILNSLYGKDTQTFTLKSALLFQSYGEGRPRPRHHRGFQPG